MQAIRARKPWDISIYLIDRILVKKLDEPVFQALKFWDNSSGFGYWSVRENFDFFEEAFRAMKNQNISSCVIDWIGLQKVWASQASYPSC